MTMASRATTHSTRPRWRELYWWSNDGVRLHARVYDAANPADPALLPVVCIPGLTRNARDFGELAPRLADRRRVYVVDLRGRGDSGYARDAMSYGPLTDVQDVIALLAQEQVDRFIAVGTSLGGVVTMLIAGTQHGRVAAAVLNDVGPQIEAAGMDRIRSNVGQVSVFPTWVHAARAVAAANAAIYPDWQLEDWLVMVKRTHRLTPEGRIVADYDANIAQPFRVPGGGEAGVDLWPALDALADVPVVLVRGALSDVLSGDVAARMVARLPHARLIEIPRTGHAPTLDEPVAAEAIATLVNDLSQ